MKKIGSLIIIAVILIGGVIFFEKAKAPEAKVEAEKTNNEVPKLNEKVEEKKMGELKFPGVLPDEKIKNKKVVLTTTKGVIEFELYADKAPKTVSNFVALAESKYYDGLTFHRVVPDFVIQGGDPTGNGTGGPGYQFEDEPVVGDYKLGTVAMANSGPDSNGSQFFICLDDLSTLPKSYNLFGQVTKGIEVVKEIAVGNKMEKVEIANLN